MTNPNNGATLEDCHSNFFALTDLCGIKWRRFISDGLMGSGHGHHSFGPLDDPVLSSFARCLATDILCVWRKSPSTRNQQQNQFAASSNDQFHATAALNPSQFMQHAPNTPGSGSSLPSSQSVQMHMPHHLSAHLMPPHGGVNLGQSPATHATPHHHLNVPNPYPSRPGQPSTPHHSHSQGMPSQQSATMHNQQQQYNNPSLNGPKELWIFWYGEDPDLTNLVSPQLLKGESDNGSWENGLSYECRTLLFKALHNLIERCLLTREFIRIDKWFIQPCDDSQRIGLKAFPMQLSFSFEFFVHGESTVCMSVDVRQHPPIRRIQKLHLSVSQSQPAPVILAPYGLAGSLTGVGYKMTDPGTHKILEEWKHFYPVDAVLKSNSYETTSTAASYSSPHPNNAASSTSPGSTSTSSGLPPVVEVRVGGVIMRYPSCYVLSTETDEVLSQEGVLQPNSNNLRFNSTNTPKSRCATWSDSEAAACPTGPAPNKPQGSVVGTQEIDKVEGILPERVWQECILSSAKFASDSSPSISSSNFGTGSASEVVGQWDFVDPTKKSICTCSRCNNRTISSIRGNLTTMGGNSATASSQSTKSGGSTKVKKSTYHKRNPQQQSALSSWGNLWDFAEDCLANSSSIGPTTSGSMVACNEAASLTTNQATSSRVNTMPGTPLGGPPSYKAGPGSIIPVGLGSDGGIGASPASVAPSPLATPKSQPASVQQAEPAMPTLSPQPPSEKQPAATPDMTAPKSVSSISNQAFSPAVAAGLDGAKAESGEASSAGKTTSVADVNQNTATSVGTSNDGPVSSVQLLLSWTAKGLRRPILPSKEYELQLEEESRCQPSDRIYDDTLMQAWLNHPVKRMKTNDGRGTATMYTWGFGMKRIPEVPPSILTNVPHDRHHGKRPSDPYDFDNDQQRGLGSKRKDTMKDEARSPSQGESVNGCKSGPRNLLTSEGLKPSMIDLDQIFDNSDTSSDETFQAPTPPGSNKPAGSIEDVVSTQIKAKTGLTLRPEELSKMFPTPPSHEHYPVSSPSGVQPETPSAIESIADNSKRAHDNYSADCSPTDDANESRMEANAGYSKSGSAQSHNRNHGQDWSYVYKPPSVCKMLGSSKYAPLHVLPSQQLPPLTLSITSTYTPSWQTASASSAPVAQCTTTPSVTTSLGRNVNLQSSTSNLSHFSQPHLRPGLSPISPAASGIRGPASDLGSPPSNMYLTLRTGSATPSQVALPLSSQSGQSSAQSAPQPTFNNRGSEAHALVVNLSLSDSVINLFRDHNFDSCTMCVCNAGPKIVGNIRGSEVGLYVPDPSPEEDPVRCNCGFSASVNRRLAHRAGLFYEDEYEITTAALASMVLLPDEWYDRQKPSLLLLDSRYPDMAALSADKDAISASSIVDTVPAFLLELLREQCLLSYENNASKFSGDIVDHKRMETMHNFLDYLDGNRAALIALEHGRTVMIEAKGVLSRSAEDAMPLKSNQSIMHQWPYLWGRGPQASQDVMQVMRMLLPLLQEAVHAKAWDAQFTVLGPLTWRQFHRLAGRGTDVRCEPQPIPSILLGSEKDFVALSPLAIKFWEKLSLEPYGYPRDVAYIVLSPDCEYVLSKVRTFFRELSTVYETCQLGKHSPITKVLRDGILRVGKSAAVKLSSEPVDEWFTKLPDIPTAAVLRLYAQVCRHHLVPQLANISLDQHLFDNASHSSQHRDRPTPSPKMPPPNADAPVSMNPGQGPSTPKAEFETEAPTKEVPVQECLEDDEREPPALVVYLVDPFGFSVDNKDVHRMANLGLLRCFASTLNLLPENIRNNISVQVVSLEDILSLGNHLFDAKLKNDQLRHLSLTVYSQCRRVVSHQNNVKSLTGFGPAAAGELFQKTKDDKKSGSYKLYTPPYVLAPTKEKISEGVEWVAGMPGHSVGGMVSSGNGLTVGPSFSPTSSSVLYVAYCISEDHRWLLASATDERGELLETTVISIYVPNRSRRKKASARKHGLHRLMDFILGLMSTGVHPWRLVVGRLGRVGHGELESWSSLLSRKSLLRASNQLRDSCRQCGLQCPGDCPCVLSACLVSLEPDSCLRLMPDQFTPDERFGMNAGGGSSSTLSTPQDISCTHVMAFPTSATTQSSQTTFQAEHINPGEDDDLFLGMEGDDMGGDEGLSAGLDFNDIFGQWEDNATGGQSPLGSPRRDSASQPGSPGGVGASGRQSPGFQSGSQGRTGRSGEPGEDFGTVLQQPLALGYYVSTAPAGDLPSWFWASCPQRSVEQNSAVFFKSALHLHSHSVLHNMDDLLQQQSLAKQHPLDSQLTADVLRFVLEGYNALSWLYFDPRTHDRRSCLPIHMQKLLQLYHTLSALV